MEKGNALGRKGNGQRSSDWRRRKGGNGQTVVGDVKIGMSLDGEGRVCGRYSGGRG